MAQKKQSENDKSQKSTEKHAKIEDIMLEENMLYDLAELFKIFGDSTRIQILFALIETPLSVNEIAETLRLSQSAVSHQLRILKANRLVKYVRDGKKIIYSLSDSHVNSILNQGIDHLAE